MRVTSLLFAVFLSSAAQAAPGEESFQGALARGAAPQPSQLSFAELYRLTLAAPAAPGLPVLAAPDAPIRVAAAQPPAQFSVVDAPKPELGLLLLSGLAAAVWVARRRLGYGY
jgi:hypothetical protein